jgi:hypothetical protein
MTFTVATDRLAALASDLESLASTFENVAQRSVGYAGRSDAEPIEDALAHFLARSTSGMKQLHDDMTKLAAHLRDAIAGYQDTDQAIARAAKGTGT